MPTLILPTRYTPDSVSLWNAALSASWSAERLQSWKPPLWLKEREPVIYGEPLFAATVADALGLALLEAPLDWLTSVPATYLNRPVRYATLGDARQRTEPAFIKPADDKCFPAQVYASGAELAAVADLPDDIPVLVSQPVTWDVEYRCFVLERRVVTLSPYFRDGELVQTPDGDWPASPAEKEESLAFAAAVLADASVQIPPALVLDIGRIAEKGWSVVEANPAWSSGIYGCDQARVLPVLRRACVSEARLATEDMRWVLDRSGLP